MRNHPATLSLVARLIAGSDFEGMLPHAPAIRRMISVLATPNRIAPTRPAPSPTALNTSGSGIADTMSARRGTCQAGSCPRASRHIAALGQPSARSYRGASVIKSVSKMVGGFDVQGTSRTGEGSVEVYEGRSCYRSGRRGCSSVAG
jgi:hypothetical protein